MAKEIYKSNNNKITQDTSPIVSVIIPTYNRSDLLPRAIRSVLRQTYTNLECIVVDDASTDDTKNVVQKFNDDRLVYIRHEVNQHNAAAVNTGISHTKGDLIAFLDDDDEWLPTKLEKQVPHLLRLPNDVGMTYCWMDYYDKGKKVQEHHPTYRGYVFPYVLDAQRIGGSSTLLVRPSVIKKVGGFDESLRRGVIGDFNRRVCLHYKVDFVPEVLVKVHIGHGHKRMTRNDKQGIRNVIKGQSVKLTKFKDVLHKYPRQTANIYTMIAYRYSQLDDWQNAFIFYWKAFSTFPFSARVYVNLVRSLKEKIVRLLHK